MFCVVINDQCAQKLNELDSVLRARRIFVTMELERTTSNPVKCSVVSVRGFGFVGGTAGKMHRRLKA